MKILAFDTSTEFMSIALQIGEQTISHIQEAGPKASQLILPQIQMLLAEASISLKALDGIAFGAGPGAFTGVRVACGVAQGLAFGANLPVVAVNTLTAVAQASGQNKVIVCQDARMGEVYYSALEKKASEKNNNTWDKYEATIVCKPEAVPSLLGGDWVGVGSGWKVYDEVLSKRYEQNIVKKLTEISPTGEAILQLAQPIFIAGQATSASDARPIYIRNRVALTSNERAQGLKL